MNKVTVMRLPDWTKPGIWGAIIGGIATAIVGFSYLGWTTSSSAERMAQARAETAVVSAMVPYCAAKAEQAADAASLAKFRAETSSYSRSEIVRTAGWATLTGMTAPDSALVLACSERLQKQSATR